MAQLTFDFGESREGQIARITLAHWREHLKAVGLLEKQIEAIMDEAVRQAAAKGGRAKVKKGGTLDTLMRDNPTLRRALDGIAKQMAADLTATIEQGDKEAWMRANACQDAVIAQMAANNADLAKLLASEQNKPQNDRALRAFQRREVAGMSLSERVWSLAGNAQRDMERAIEVSLAEGVPASKLSQRVRDLLREPHRLYRRVRDKDGNLRLSEAAKQYHPGRGVYRSSYKNAMRLARTEVNMAYQASDSERWSNSQFVRGIRVQLSNNHTVKDSKGRPVPLVDICDALAGDYPADFKFEGWHPQCRCFAVALTCGYDEIRDYYRRKRAGEDMANWEPKGKIKQPPAAFSRWIENNSDRLEASAARGTTPYFVRDNAKYTGATPSKKSILELAAERHAARTPEEVDRIQTAWDKRKVRIEAETKIGPLYESNIRELADALGIEPGEAMSFEQANEMRGNPNYKKGVKYRVNCQSSVLANEMRRRGFDVEAYGNTKQDWYMPTMLAKKPEMAFMDANGEIPIPKPIKYNGDLISSLNGEIKEQGRYHLRFRFANDGGHIITVERLSDGSLRIYDPQSGKIIRNFSEYVSKIKPDSFEYYRIDNLRINPDVAKGSVKLAKSKGEAPRMKMAQITEFLEKGWYGEEDYYSPKVRTILSTLRDKDKKVAYFEDLLKDESFSLDYIDNNGRKTLVHPSHKVKDAYWEETRKMSHTLNKAGRDVIFLPEHNNISMADAITKFKETPRVVDFKYSASVKPNTLQQHLEEGFEQAGAVVLKLENMDAGQFREAIDYLARNKKPIGDIILINQYGEVMELTSKSLRINSYRNKIKGFLK